MKYSILILSVSLHKNINKNKRLLPPPVTVLGRGAVWAFEGTTPSETLFVPYEYFTLTF